MRLRSVCVTQSHAVCACAARSQCVWCMWSLLARVGKIASLSPSAEDGRSRTPTLRVDALPPQGNHMHPNTTRLTPLTFWGESLLGVPGLHCSAQSV